MFNTERYHRFLKTRTFGHHLSYFEQIDSTNIYAKSAADMDEGAVILAEVQTKGRGQHSRGWTAASGLDLTFSIILKPESPERLMLLAPVCAYSVAEAIQEHTPVSDIEIKWPNDLLIRQKKVTGILSEAVFIGSRLTRVAVGIGINVNNTAFEGQFRREATSLAVEAGRIFDREQLLADILYRLELNYPLWQRGDTDFITAINQKMQGFGEWVGIEVDEKRLSGVYKFLGLNKDGALQVLNKDFELNTFAYEQVRIRID